MLSLKSQDHKDKRWIYYGTIAAIHAAASILPEHKPWISSDTEKQKFVKRNTIPTNELVATNLTLMTIVTNPFRGSFYRRDDGLNNWIGLVDAMIAQHSVTRFVKNLIRRERPNKQRAPVSFWSGHAAVSFTTANYISRYINDYSNMPNGLKWTSYLGLAAAASYVSWTRVDDFQHHTDDVIIGAVWGILASTLIYEIRNDGLFGLFKGNSEKYKENSSFIINFSYQF